jgi:butyryl-CoA dehydrogenase
MNFEPEALQKELRDLARKFAERELQPSVLEDEKQECFRLEVIQKLGDLGLTALPLAEVWGGAGLGYQHLVAVLEELSGVHLAYAISVAVTGLTQWVLSEYGTDAQKQAYLPALASGRAVGSFSLSEAVSGSDAAALQTTARRDGDHYLLSGRKLWCTQGDLAETLIVLARTGGPGPKGISAFLVQKGMPGFTTGKREQKMGIRSSHTVELLLDQVQVPISHRVGAEGQGFEIAMRALDSGRITIAAGALGVAQKALSVACRYASERHQFGVPIGSFQGVSFLLADAATQLEAARGLVYRAAWLRDQGRPHSQEAAMAKLFATDMAMQVTTDMVQILGGAGYTEDFPVERLMREAKVLQIVEGTNQVQRVVIGRHLLSSSSPVSTAGG